jgi:hypothetical protein
MDLAFETQTKPKTNGFSFLIPRLNQKQITLVFEIWNQTKQQKMHWLFNNFPTIASLNLYQKFPDKESFPSMKISQNVGIWRKNKFQIFIVLICEAGHIK